MAQFSSDALVDAGLVEKSQLEAATSVISEEIYTCLWTNFYPMPTALEGWSFKYESLPNGDTRVCAVCPNGEYVEKTGSEEELLEYQVAAAALEMQINRRESGEDPM